MLMRVSVALFALLLPAAGQETVQIRVNAAAAQGPMRPIYSFFGYDEPNYTYMKDGRKLLTELAALIFAIFITVSREMTDCSAPCRQSPWP